MWFRPRERRFSRLDCGGAVRVGVRNMIREGRADVKVEVVMSVLFVYFVHVGYGNEEDDGNWGPMSRK